MRWRDRIRRRRSLLDVAEPSDATDDVDIVLVVGLGTFGRALAVVLHDAALPVVGLDHRPERVAELGHEFTTQVADATDPASLASAGADATAVSIICMPGSFAATVLAVTHLNDLGADQIWAMAATPAQARILQRLDAVPLDPYRDLATHYVSGIHAVMP